VTQNLKNMSLIVYAAQCSEGMGAVFVYVKSHQQRCSSKPCEGGHTESMKSCVLNLRYFKTIPWEHT
jgi:hypothetical protein